MEGFSNRDKLNDVFLDSMMQESICDHPAATDHHYPATSIFETTDNGDETEIRLSAFYDFSENRIM